MLFTDLCTELEGCSKETRSRAASRPRWQNDLAAARVVHHGDDPPADVNGMSASTPMGIRLVIIATSSPRTIPECFSFQKTLS